MDNTIQSDLIRGHIDTIILKALYDGDRYGFDIIKEIEQKSSGQYILKQPTLYSCLKRLEVQGFIKSYWGSKSNGGRRKYYTLTDMGRDLFIKNQTEWVYSRTVIDKLISDRDYDFASSLFDESQDKSHITDDENTENDSADTAADNDIEKTAAENDSNLEELTEIVDGDTFSEELAAQQLNEVSEDNDISYERHEQNIEERPYLDTTAIMNEIFDQMSDGSYTDKLKNEQYVPSENIDPNSYFNENYFDETPIAKAVPDEDDYFSSLENKSSSNDDEADSSNNYESSVYDTEKFKENIEERNLVGDNSTFPTDENIPSPNTDESKKASTPDFYSYDSEVSRPDENTVVINREYKNILWELRNRTVIDNSAIKNELPAQREFSVSHTEPEPTESGAADEIVNDDNDETTDSKSNIEFSDERIQTRNFKKLESDVKDLGDGVKIRTHSSNTAKEYANTYYFYSNKLMLSHYLILFVLMLLEISITFFAVVFGTSVEQKHALLFFILAVVVALSFPTVAFIMNLVNPNKKRRITFNFKISMLFRVIVMIEALILIYAVNLMMRMPLTFSSEYLATLLIPAIMTINIPISSMIFQSLYKSGKYNVE